jgi:hypothetical protein
MKQILVWYQRGNIAGSIHLEIKNESIAYTIAEFESRNSGTTITHYQTEDDWIIIKI